MQLKQKIMVLPQRRFPGLSLAAAKTKKRLAERQRHQRRFDDLAQVHLTFDEAMDFAFTEYAPLLQKLAR